jgi:hypothetical protein
MAAVRRCSRRNGCPVARGPRRILAGERDALGKCHAAATCVHGRALDEPPPGRRDCRNTPAGPLTARAVRGSPVGHITASRKNFCCVTTRRGNLRLFQHLRRRRDTPTARTLNLGMLGLDLLILSATRLPSRRLPAAHLAQALRVLAITLVPTVGLILPPAALAQANPRPRSSRTGNWAALGITMMTTHGREADLPRDSPGRMLEHSPRALLTTNQTAWPVYESMRPR